MSQLENHCCILNKMFQEPTEKINVPNPSELLQRNNIQENKTETFLKIKVSAQ